MVFWTLQRQKHAEIVSQDKKKMQETYPMMTFFFDIRGSKTPGSVVAKTETTQVHYQCWLCVASIMFASAGGFGFIDAWCFYQDSAATWCSRQDVPFRLPFSTPKCRDSFGMASSFHGFIYFPATITTFSVVGLFSNGFCYSSQMPFLAHRRSSLVVGWTSQVSDSMTFVWSRLTKMHLQNWSEPSEPTEPTEIMEFKSGIWKMRWRNQLYRIF